MITGIFFLFAFDFGWRGYGFLSHVLLPAAMFVFMAIYTYSTMKMAPFSILDITLLGSIFFELTCFLLAWGLGRGARRLFGGGEPY